MGLNCKKLMLTPIVKHFVIDGTLWIIFEPVFVRDPPVAISEELVAINHFANEPRIF
jgi:hypothetical protein